MNPGSAGRQTTVLPELPRLPVGLQESIHLCPQSLVRPTGVIEKRLPLPTRGPLQRILENWSRFMAFSRTALRMQHDRPLISMRKKTAKRFKPARHFSNCAIHSTVLPPSCAEAARHGRTSSIGGPYTRDICRISQHCSTLKPPK